MLEYKIFREEFKISLEDKFKNDINKTEMKVTIGNVTVPLNIKCGHMNIEILDNNLDFTEEYIDHISQNMYMLYLFTLFAKEKNILYTLAAGNLLGYYREKRLIFWDDDIDISVSDAHWKYIDDLFNNNNIPAQSCWDKNWIYKTIHLYDFKLQILKSRNRNGNGWYKFRFPNKFDRRDQKDIGGIDLFKTNVNHYKVKKGFYGPYGIFCGPMKESNIDDYNEVKYMNIKVRVVKKELAHLWLTTQYGDYMKVCLQR